MDVVFGVILVIIFLLIVLGPVLRRFLGPMIQRWMLGKMEDNMRRMAGMPTRKEEKQARKRAAKREKSGAAGFRNAAYGSRSAGRHSSARPNGVDMLRSYAEDVEFVEIKSYSREVEIGAGRDRDSRRSRTVVEEQIEDAEFVEIKK